MKIVLLNNSYIDEITDIEHKCFSIPWTKGMFEEEFKKPMAVYVGAVEKGKLIGYGGLWKIFDEGHITNIAVVPECQRKGVGKRIVGALADLCKRNSINKMTLEVRVSNTAAIALYKGFGFADAGIRKAYYEDNKEDALIMWTDL